MFGSIPPIDRPAPTIPPAVSRQGAVGQRAVPANAGNVNPNGGLLLVPGTKTGRFPGAFAAKNVGRIKPGGIPRNSSWMFAGVSQLEYIPNPPRKSQSPVPLMPHAAASRGVYAVGEPLHAICVGFATPVAA